MPGRGPSYFLIIRPEEAERDYGFSSNDNRYAEVTRRHVLRHNALQGYDGHVEWIECDCQDSRGIRDRLEQEEFFMTDDTKLHGPEQEMTVDEWKEIHNDERKSVKDMTNAELQEHYYKLLRVIRLTKIRVQASHLVLQERIEVADLEEREAIRERDKKYKVKPVISETGEKKERAPRQTQMAKLQGSLAGLGIDLSAMLKAKEAAKAPRKSAEEKLKESLGNLGLDPSKMMEKK